MLAERRQQAVERTARAERQLANQGARLGGARESIFANENAQDRRFRLSQRIQRLEDRGVNVDRLRTRLGDLTTSYAQRQYGTARQLSRELGRQVSLTEARARRERDALRLVERQARIGGPRSPINGSANLPGSPAFIEQQKRIGGPRSPIGGSVLIPGSPAFNRLQERLLRQEEQRQQRQVERNARLGGPRSPINGSVLIPGSPRFIEQQRQRQEQEAARNAALGGPRSPINGSVLIPGSPAFRKLQERLVRQAEQRQQREIERSARLGGPRSPINGSKLIPGSPAFLKEQERLDARARKQQERAADAARRQRRDTLGSAIIGGAFPALFGQGIGASVGGAVGGGVGGRIGGQFGFGLSLVGTALGAQFDVALQKATTLAAGLDDPIGKFQELRDAALLSSRAIEKQAQALIDSGRGAEAAALIQADLNRTFGSQQGASAYRDAVDTLTRSFSQGATVLASFVAGPLAALVRELEKPTGNFATATRFEQLAGQLTPDQYRRADAARIRATEAARRSRGGLSSFLPPSEGDVAQGRQAFIEQARRELGVEQQIVLTEKQKVSLANNTLKLRSNAYRQIDAEVFGNKKLTLELQKQQIELERKNKLAELGSNPAPAAVEAINSDAARETYRLTQQAAQLERQKWSESIASANRIKDIQDQIAIQGQRGGLSDVGIGALQAVAQLRSAIRREQDAQAALRADPGNEQLLNASREAAENTRLAAAKAKADLIDAFKAAQDAVRSISRGIEDSTSQLLRLRGGTGGLNQFLRGQALANNQQLAFQQILPQFQRARELAARDAERNGNPYAARQFRSFNISGDTAAVNQRMLDFIDAQRGQDRLMEDLATSNRDLVKANTSLAVVVQALNSSNLGETLPTLATSINALAQKDWSVQISVASDGTSTAYGDVLNGAVTS